MAEELQPKTLGPGSQLSHFKITRVLGVGGMGVVYEARDTRLGRAVALKVLSPHLFAEERARRRFLQEAQLASAITHPHVATIYDVGEEGDTPFIALELVPGHDLKTLLLAGPLPIDRVITIGRQVCEGLEAAHRLGVIHRDVKSANIMVTPEWQAKILDFGLAKALEALSPLEEADQESAEVGLESTGPPGEDTTAERALTARAVAVGTPSYMSPEQASGKPIDVRTDIYSFGVVLYEALSGRLPFQGCSSSEILKAIRNLQPTSLHQIQPSVPTAMSDLVSRCLEKNPSKRFPAADALGEALGSLKKRPWELIKDEWQSGSRRRRLLLRAATALMVAVIAIAPVFWRITSRKADQTIAIRPRVAVLPPRDLTSSGVNPVWPELIQTLLASELTGVAEFGVVDPLSLNALIRDRLASDSPVRSSALYPALLDRNISLLIDGTLLDSSTGVQLTVNLRDLHVSENRLSRTAALPSEDSIPSAVSRLSEEMIAYLQVEVLGLSEDVNLRPWISYHKYNVEAVKAFLQASYYVHRAEGGAEPYLRQAIQIDPSFVSPRVWMIPTLVMEGRSDQALLTLEALLELAETANPFEQAMIAYVDAYVRGDVAGMARHLEMALSYSPGNYILMGNLAGAHYRMKDYEAAVKAMRPLLEAGWEYPPLYFLWGVSNIRLNRFQEAREGLEEGLSVPPVNSGVYGALEALSILERRTDRENEYRQLFESRLALTRTDSRRRNVAVELADVAHILGDHALRSGDYGISTRLFERAISHAPYDARHHDKLGESLYLSGDWDAAETRFLKAVELDADRGTAYRRLGEICDRRGDLDRAMAYYEKFLSLSPPSDETTRIRQRLSEIQKSKLITFKLRRHL